MAFLPDGLRAVVAWSDGLLELRHTDGEGAVLRTFEGHLGSIHAKALSKQGDRLAVVANGVCAWDVLSGELLRTWDTVGVHLSVAFSREGDLLTGARVGGLFRFAFEGP